MRYKIYDLDIYTMPINLNELQNQLKIQELGDQIDYKLILYELFFYNSWWTRRVWSFPKLCILFEVFDLSVLENCNFYKSILFKGSKNIFQTCYSKQGSLEWNRKRIIHSPIQSYSFPLTLFQKLSLYYEYHSMKILLSMLIFRYQSNSTITNWFFNHWLSES